MPDKLLLVSTGDTVKHLIDQHPDLKLYDIFQLNETCVFDLWQRINRLSSLPSPCRQSVFFDLLQVQEQPYDCFISYRTASVNTVRFFAEQLIARGAKPWFAEWEILVSGRRGFQEAINHGLASSRTALCCTNAGYSASEYCRIEAMQVLDVPGKEHRNILELRMPAEPNAISTALQQKGSDAVSVDEQTLGETWSQCCEFLGIPNETLPRRETGGHIVRLNVAETQFHINIDDRWSVNEYIKPVVPIKLGNIISAGFTREIGTVCLECILIVGPVTIVFPEGDDRAMFEALIDGMRMMNRMGKILYTKGVHVVHVPALHNTSQLYAHPAITYLDPDRDDYDGRQVPIEKCVWHRKYSIQVTPPHMPSPMEFVFDFDMRNVAHDDFVTFCRHAYMMDDLVRGLGFDA